MEKSWLAQFFVSHYGFVVSLAFKFAPRPDLVRDIVQQVFIELLGEERTFPNETELKLHLRKLTRRVAQRYWNEHYRKRGETFHLLAQHLASIVEANDVPHDLDGEIGALRRCLQNLPTKSKSVIEGYYFKDQSPTLIGQKLGMTIDAVYKAIGRIRQKLRDCIEMVVKQEEDHA